MAELERSLNRLELRLLLSSADAATERRRRCLQSASVYAFDDLLAQ
jgi:hypothetical protein